MNPLAMGLLGDILSVSKTTSASGTKSAAATVKVPAPGKAGTDVNLVKVVVNLNWR